MVPIRLNLLSPEKRRAHRSAIYMQFIKNMLEELLIILCLSTIVLVYGLHLVENRVQDISSQRLIADSAFTKSNREVDTINSTLRRVEAIGDAHIFWTPLMGVFIHAIPADIRLDALSMDMTGRSITFSGYAPTRESLLSLKKSLETVPWIAPFELPIQQLTQKNNVAFSFTMGIKE